MQLSHNSHLHACMKVWQIKSNYSKRKKRLMKYLLLGNIKLASNDLSHLQSTFRFRQHSSETVKCLIGKDKQYKNQLESGMQSNRVLKTIKSTQSRKLSNHCTQCNGQYGIPGTDIFCIIRHPFWLSFFQFAFLSVVLLNTPDEVISNTKGRESWKSNRSL